VNKRCQQCGGLGIRVERFKFVYPVDHQRGVLALDGVPAWTEFLYRCTACFHQWDATVTADRPSRSTAPGPVQPAT
jgi:hypothetical protein